MMPSDTLGTHELTVAINRAPPIERSYCLGCASLLSVFHAPTASASGAIDAPAPITLYELRASMRSPAIWPTRYTSSVLYVFP